MATDDNGDDDDDDVDDESYYYYYYYYIQAYNSFEESLRAKHGGGNIDLNGCVVIALNRMMPVKHLCDNANNNNNNTYNNANYNNTNYNNANYFNTNFNYNPG